MTERQDPRLWNPVWPRRAERWRKPVIVGLSLGLHALVLGLIGLRSMDLAAPVDPVERVVYIEIEPRPLLAGEVARVRPPPARPDAPSQALPNAGIPVTQADPVRRLADEEDRPAPRLAAPGAPAPPADVGTAPWRVRPETMGDRVGRGLRTSPVGCASPRLLSPAERAICDDRLGERAAAAAPIEGTGNPERDARFAREGARALAEYEARRRPLSGGTGVIGPGECPGSNFGTGCAGAYLAPEMRHGATTTHNPGQSKSGFSFRVGPLRSGDE